ncbi:hypothetical protein JKP75_15550 [Blastococcus sp. TML/M2B]|uniref:hypothetical protein n=1 Tax=Blastococcus sp. TML/M2B TaxID=2798727 RepID=UPI00190C4865|nr:hypothetical protein [Blastococcus sp. TML/M2B]MBN1093842.1 hypothetical protein [Blastococcus sp. TML/M2B]
MSVVTSAQTGHTRAKRLKTKVAALPIVNRPPTSHDVAAGDHVAAEDEEHLDPEPPGVQDRSHQRHLVQVGHEDRLEVPDHHDHRGDEAQAGQRADLPARHRRQVG